MVTGTRRKGEVLVSGEWVVCRKCGLKYRTREATCPRCENPTEEDQVRWTTDGSLPPPPEGSGLAIAVPVGLVLALIGAGVFLGPLGGRGAGSTTLGLVLAGLLVIGVSWAWGITLAFRTSVPAGVFSVLVPYVSLVTAARWKALLPQLGGTALVALGVFLAPAGFFQRGPAQVIRQACEARNGADCACLGAKTVSLMTPAERQAEFVPGNAQSAELLLTAANLCIKDRLVARCVSAKQGNELQCICIIDKAINSFSPEDLELAITSAASGSSPPRYGNARIDCLAQIP
jgi:hypothetical protein